MGAPGVHHIQCAAFQDGRPPQAEPLGESLGASLAALIDRRVRAGHEADGPGSTGATGPNGSVLVWLDHPGPGSGPGPESGPVAGSGRGVIVVMHRASQAVGARSFVVSFPAGTGGRGRQLGAVSRLLAAMGWSLLAFKRRQTEVGHADTAVLVNTRRFGGEQRLWLAEPVEGHTEPGSAPRQAWARPGAMSSAGGKATA